MSEHLRVTPIPGEYGRYWVKSRTRDMEHLVDTEYQEEQNQKPRPMCSCEESMAKGNVCAHILAVSVYLEKERRK